MSDTAELVKAIHALQHQILMLGISLASVIAIGLCMIADAITGKSKGRMRQ